MDAFTNFFSQLPRPVMLGIFVIVLAGMVYSLAQLVKGVAKSGKPAPKTEADKAEADKAEEQKP